MQRRENDKLAELQKAREEETRIEQLRKENDTDSDHLAAINP